MMRVFAVTFSLLSMIDQAYDILLLQNIDDLLWSMKFALDIKPYFCEAVVWDPHIKNYIHVLLMIDRYFLENIHKYRFILYRLYNNLNDRSLISGIKLPIIIFVFDKVWNIFGKKTRWKYVVLCIYSVTYLTRSLGN